MSGKKLRVTLRVNAMRVAGKWFIDLIETRPHLRNSFSNEALDLLYSFSRRSGKFIEIDRIVAERFVDGWTYIIEQSDPMLFIQVRPCTGTPETGEEAIAEIVVDINKALRNGKGRPPEIDPLQAYEANLKHKRSRKRNYFSGVAGDPYASELAAESLGVKSKTSTEEAITKGRETATNISNAKAMLPDGAEVLFVLTDSHDGGKTGVLVASVPRCKKDVD